MNVSLTFEMPNDINIKLFEYSGPDTSSCFMVGEGTQESSWNSDGWMYGIVCRIVWYSHRLNEFRGSI